MREALKKKLEYVILPIIIPASIKPEKTLDDNQTYRVVWQILNALHSHDNCFNATINKLKFNGKSYSKI